MADIDQVMHKDSKGMLPEGDHPPASIPERKRKHRSDPVSAEEAFIVSCIVKRRLIRKKIIEYLVEWGDYP